MTAPGHSQAPGGARARALARIGDALRLAWMLLLLLPAATSASAWHDWDLRPLVLLAVSGWWVLGMRLLLPGPAFFLLSYPAACASVVVLGADLLRQIALLELAAQWKTFDAADAAAVLRPYAGPALLAAGGLALWSVACMRLAGTRPPRAWSWTRRLAIVGVTSAGLAAAVPGIAWTRAWPASPLVIAASAAAREPAWAAYAVAGAGVDPGRPDDPWGATRAQVPDVPETLVLVIGESLRADVLRECGGPSALRTVAAGAVVACDVTAGSNATHTAVPLLIGRSMPGLPMRIPADSTFQRALAHVGFHTAWVGAQTVDVAWPDAREQHHQPRSDREVLLPALDRVLAAGHPRLSLVLHMIGAHEPYCARYERRSAPYESALCQPGSHAPAATPGPDERAAWLSAYANAADASIGVLNDIIVRLSAAPGRVFLAFTPDHGENLLDDARGLFGHAQRQPSPWDIRVPAVFWANEAWRRAHPQAWQQLQRQARLPLMHADLVPTLLQAAGVQVQDPRPQPLGLLGAPLGTRVRLVQTAVGSAVPYEQLLAAVKPPVVPFSLETAPRRP